jgi:hypothetical protein
MNILLKIEYIVTNFNLRKLERDDNALPLYPPPSTRPSWSQNSQQLYLVPPCNYFSILFEVDDIDILSKANQHPFRLELGFISFKLVPFVSIFHPSCSQNLSHFLSFNRIF